MASGIAAQLPLVFSDVFGPYNLITDYLSLAKQNLKMLVLTAPGERMMDINFGVGLKNYLFEQDETSLYAEINTAIRSQVATYLPYIEIQHVDFAAPENNRDLFPNTLNVKITFRVIPLQISSSIQIEVDNAGN
tara:strand:- start:1009 stop:1410 length:402 start_codon:yes stop_codon:yes gene_type:complete